MAESHTPHKPNDALGSRLRVGDEVRIVGVPPGLDGTPESARDSLPVFQYLVGKYKRITDFDEHGHAELYFRILKGPHAGMHWVWIEPHLLRKRRPRT